MTERTFRRYTNLASVLHILQNKCLTLLSPYTWDDRNDAFFMAEYKRLREAKTILAICFAVREETYHHWQVFSHGSDGVCLEFNSDRLCTALNSAAGVRHQMVDYELLTNVNKMADVDLERLPFMKRWPYGDENEYRAVYTNKDEKLAAYAVPIGLNAITRITLSPWLPPALVAVVKKSLKSMPGCSGIPIYRSTLIDNNQWKKLTGRVAIPVMPPGN